jgi:hypothetical protein
MAALPKVDAAGNRQQRRGGQQQPCSGCEHRTLHQLFILLRVRANRLHTRSVKFKQPMFQLDIAKLLQRLAQLCDFAVVSDCERSSRVSELSIFSYSSEILEKPVKRRRHGGLEKVPPFLL